MIVEGRRIQLVLRLNVNEPTMLTGVIGVPNSRAIRKIPSRNGPTRPVIVLPPSGKAARLTPRFIAARVKRHMRLRPDGRLAPGTGTLPKRFISQPYTGIRKCDSS